MIVYRSISALRWFRLRQQIDFNLAQEISLLTVLIARFAIVLLFSTQFLLATEIKNSTEATAKIIDGILADRNEDSLEFFEAFKAGQDGQKTDLIKVFIKDETARKTKLIQFDGGIWKNASRLFDKNIILDGQKSSTDNLEDVKIALLGRSSSLIELNSVLGKFNALPQQRSLIEELLKWSNRNASNFEKSRRLLAKSAILNEFNPEFGGHLDGDNLKNEHLDQAVSDLMHIQENRGALTEQQWGESYTAWVKEISVKRRLLINMQKVNVQENTP